MFKDELQPKSKKALIILLELFSLGLGLYLIVWPFYVNKKYNPALAPNPAEQSLLIDKATVALKAEAAKPVEPAAHRLLIPKIGVEAPIVEGKNESALERGVWRLPEGVKPGEKGNLILTGHRFKYLPPNNTTFYHLDKLAVGDKLALVWDKQVFNYEVKEVKIVADDDLSIVAPSEQEMLTIYTCHPLWSQAQRLVIVAKPLDK